MDILKNKSNFLKTSAIVLTFAVLFQFLIFGISKPTNYYSRPVDAIAFSLSTSEGKYLIKDAYDLESFRKSVNSGEYTSNKTFVLTAPISVLSSFVSIGTAQYPFRGTFDSAGIYCKITNLKKPLFGYTNGATIQNIEIESGTISYSSNYVGSVVGNAVNTNVYRCYNGASVTNTQTSGNAYVGGIVGYINGGSVRECTNAGDVNNSSNKVDKAYAGGIFGFAEPNVGISDCVVYNSNNKIKISANAKVTENTTTVRSTNDSVYYSRLETVNQAAQEALNKAKAVLASKENEQNALRREINNAHAWIADRNAYIARRTREANDSFLGAKWAYIGPEIAGIYAAIGARYTEIGALEAALKIAEGAVWVAKGAVDLALKTASKSVYDMQWVNAYNNCTKTAKTQYAYAYGIGYTNGSVYNSYTAKVKTSAGNESTTYNFYLKFWAQSINQNIMTSSEAISRSITFYNNGFFGPVSNGDTYSCFYYEDTPSYKREIKVNNGNNMYNTNSSIQSEHSNIVRFGKQKLIFTNSGATMYVRVNNSTNTALTTINECNYENSLLSLRGSTCGSSLATLTNKVKSELSSNVWGTESSLENGYPHLKYRYWQYYAED